MVRTLSDLKRIINLPIWIVPVALLLVCIISYGTLVSKLGFYWDDWTIAYYIHFLGPSSFREAFAFDRPLLAWIYMLTTSLLGESPTHWQAFAVVTRWLACVAFWWALKGLWPHKTVQITAATLLFAVYPGFQQQFIAITYGNAFLVYAIFLVSLGAMVWAFRKPRWFWPFYLLSIGLMGYTLFTVEYFVGLELLRPVFLWMAMRTTGQDTTGQSTAEQNIAVVNKPRKQFLRLGLYWAPYVVLALLFLA